MSERTVNCFKRTVAPTRTVPKRTIEKRTVPNKTVTNRMVSKRTIHIRNDRKVNQCSSSLYLSLSFFELREWEKANELSLNENQLKEWDKDYFILTEGNWRESSVTKNISVFIHRYFYFWAHLYICVRKYILLKTDFEWFSSSAIKQKVIINHVINFRYKMWITI